MNLKCIKNWVQFLLQLSAHGQSDPEPLTAGPRGHDGWPGQRRAQWPGSKGESARAGAMPRAGVGDCRRRGAPSDARRSSNDADLQREPYSGGAATPRSPETMRATMAHGGAEPKHGELRKTGSCRRYLAQTEGAKWYRGSHSHHEAVGVVGETGGCSRWPGLKTKAVRWCRRENDDVGGLTAPQEACVDEDVEDDEALLLLQAI